MELDEVVAETERLSGVAHLATVGADGHPDVIPVMPAWRDGTLWVASGTDSVKVRNIAANPNIAIHWQVDDSGDGVQVWGTATVRTDPETKRELWTGLFPYDLDSVLPGGPDSPDGCMLAITPTRALVLKQFGMAGRHAWTAGGNAAR